MRKNSIAVKAIWRTPSPKVLVPKDQFQGNRIIIVVIIDSLIHTFIKESMVGLVKFYRVLNAPFVDIGWSMVMERKGDRKMSMM